MLMEQGALNEGFVLKKTKANNDLQDTIF